MSKPIDLKTVKIFEPLKKKPSFENKIFNTINAEEVYDVLSRNSNETVTLWFKLQQAWCNNAYTTFKDYDSYLILIYLVNQVFQKYSDRFQYLSFQEFYEKNDRRMNIIGQNGNDGLHYDKIADSDKVINIVVEGGMVVEVNGLPVDWQYYIDDRDCPPEIEDE